MKLIGFKKYYVIFPEFSRFSKWIHSANLHEKWQVSLVLAQISGDLSISFTSKIWQGHGKIFWPPPTFLRPDHYLCRADFQPNQISGRRLIRIRIHRNHRGGRISWFPRKMKNKQKYLHHKLTKVNK